MTPLPRRVWRRVEAVSTRCLPTEPPRRLCRLNPWRYRGRTPWPSEAITHRSHLWSSAPTIPTSERAHWTNASGSGTGALPNIPIGALVIDGDFSDTVYVATDIGVFRTRDAGAHWEPFSNGLPRVVVSGLLSGTAERSVR